MKLSVCAVSQAPGNTIITRQVAPSTVVRQGAPPTPTSLAATTALHRPPILQVNTTCGSQTLSDCVHSACCTLFTRASVMQSVSFTVWNWVVSAFFHNENDANSHNVEDV